MLVSVVEVAQWDRDPRFHVRSSPLPGLVSKVSGAAKEAGVEVEGIVGAAAALAALLGLFLAVVAVLVVDTAGFGLGEGVVGFCYLDEFFRGGLVTTAETKKISFDCLCKAIFNGLRFRM